MERAVFSIPNFLGLDTRGDVTTIAFNALRILENFVYKNNIWVRKKGRSKYNSTAIHATEEVRGLDNYTDDNGDAMLLAMCNGKGRKTTGDGDMGSDLTLPDGSAVSFDNINNDVYAVEIRGLLYLFNGDTTDYALMFNGTNLIDGSRFMAEKDATGGTVSTLIDTVNLTQADTDYWEGLFIRIYDTSQGTYHRAWITEFDPATDKVTFSPAMPLAVVSGDKYEIAGGGIWKEKNGKYAILHDNRICVALGSLLHCTERYWPDEWNALKDSYPLVFHPGWKDGEEITALASLDEFIVVFKPHNIYVIRAIGDPDNWPIIKIVGTDSNKGAIWHRTIDRGFGGIIYYSWDGVYVLDRTLNVRCVSRYIDPTIRALAQSISNPGGISSVTKIDTTKVHFEAGTQDPVNSIDTTTEEGTFRSTLSINDWLETLTADFDTGVIKDNIDTASDEIKLSTREDDPSNLSPGKTVITGGGMEGWNSTGNINDNNLNSYADCLYTSGAYIGINLGITENIRHIYFKGQLYSGWGPQYMYGKLQYYDGSWHDISGSTEYYWVGEGGGTHMHITDINVSFNASRIRWYLYDGYFNPWSRAYELKIYRKKWTTGHFRSQEKDLGGTYAFGNFYESHLAGQTYTFEVRKYLDGNWSDWVEVTNGNQIPLSGGSKVQYDVVSTSGNGAVNPIVYDIKIQYKEYLAGSLISRIHDLGAVPTQWRPFKATETLNGCTIVWQIRSDDDSGMASPTAWVTVENGGIPSLTLQRYVQSKSNLTPTYAATPVVEDVTIQVYLGVATNSPCAIVWNRGYELCVRDIGSDTNNVVFRLDENSWMYEIGSDNKPLERWTKKTGIEATKFIIFNDQVMSGSVGETNKGGFLYYEDVGTKDLEVDFTARLITGRIDFSSPEHPTFREREKVFKEIFSKYKSQQDASLYYKEDLEDWSSAIILGAHVEARVEQDWFRGLVRGKTLTLKYEQSVADPDMELHSFDIKALITEVMR